MRVDASTLIVATAFLNSMHSVDAAPQNSTPRTQVIQAYLASHGVNASTPLTLVGSNASSLTCNILNSYKISDLVTPQDGQAYVAEAEQHWYIPASSR